MKNLFRCRILKNNLAMKKPFAYFLGTLSSLPYSLIEITDPSGIQGVGEIAHAMDINGELQEGSKGYAPYVEHILRKYSAVTSIDDIALVMKDVRLNIAHNTALLCGLEQALFFIVAQKTGKHLTQLLGTKKTLIRVQATVPYLASLDEYKTHLSSIVVENIPSHLKFKIGKDFETEFAAIEYVKELNETISVSVDANQAFVDPIAAVQFSERLGAIGIAWVEQPLHKDDINGLRYLRKLTQTPIMVDEGLHTPLEAEFYAQEGLVDYFNIKLAKTGGILKALEIIDIAKAHNIPVMLGSMLHGRLGIEYNLAFAFSQEFVTHDFFSYFNVIENEGLGYISQTLEASLQALRA